MTEKIFLISNMVCALGTILNLVRVYRNRKILKGFDLAGAVITLVAIIGFQTGFYLEGLIDSVLFGLITISYWLAITIYLIRYKL